MSAVLAASAATSTSSSLPVSKLEQKICTELVTKTGAQIIEMIGGDDSDASRLKSGKLNLSWMKFVRLLSALGYKVVNKNMQCVTQHEMRALQDCYTFMNSSSDLRARFSAWRETQPLENDWDAPIQ